MNYSNYKKMMLDSKTYLSNDEVKLDTVSMQSKLFRVSNNFLSNLKERISMICSLDNRFVEIINKFRSEKNIKIRSNEDNFTTNQSIGTQISIVNNETKDKIKFFFLGLNQKMRNIRDARNKKYPKPEGLSYKNPELEKLKKLREEAINELNKSNNKEEALEKGSSLKLVNPNQYGFLNKGALLILLSIISCIIEFTFLIISKF